MTEVQARPMSAGRNTPFEIEPICPTIGAEIHGLDLAAPMDESRFADFEAALIRHKVVYLRDQDITPERHVEIGRMFGDVEVHPFSPQGGYPEIVRLDNDKDHPILSTDVWHADTTFRECPTKYSILRCMRIPPVGGDTLWCDVVAAYEGLSDRIRRLIDGLEAVHDFKNFRALYGDSDEDRAALREMERKYPNPTHPVVRTHPATGQRAIFVSPQFTRYIKGMRESESRALLELLFQQTHVPEYQFRLRWKPLTIAFWDNRSTQHYAANDYMPERRTMERVAVIGDKPYF